MNRKCRMFSIATVVLIFMATSALAQQIKGKFTLPFEVNWGQSTLVPGNYSFKVDIEHGLVLIDHNQRTSFVLLGYIKQPLESERRSELVTLSFENRQFVKELYVASTNTSFFFYIPLKSHVSTTVIAEASMDGASTRLPVTIMGK